MMTDDMPQPTDDATNPDNLPPGEYPDFDAEDEAISDRVWGRIAADVGGSDTMGDRPGPGPGTVY